MKRIGIFLLVLAVFWMGCGKKGPPVPPAAPVLPMVIDLSAVAGDTCVGLTWTVPAAYGNEKYAWDAFAVYRAKKSGPSVCSGCPLVFEKTARVPRESAEKTEKGLVMRFCDPAPPGFTYAYSVKADAGTRGPTITSNIAEVGF